MGNENNDFNQHLVSKFVNACLKSDGIKPDYPNFLKYSTFKNEEVCQSLFASLLSMDTTELKKLFPEGPHISSNKMKKAWKKFSSFSYSDIEIVAIFGTVKTQPNNVTIEKLNDAARSYFLMDAILKPAHTLDGRNREKLSNAIEIILEYLENFDPRWGIVYDKVLFSRLIHDLKLFYDGLPIRPQRINRQCRPEEKGRYLFINRLAGIYHDITQKAARKPGKWIQPEKDKGSVS